MFKKKGKKSYDRILLGIGDTVLAPCSVGVFRKATVTSIDHNNKRISVRFDGGNIATIPLEWCYKVVKALALPIEKPKTRVQKFCVWLLRKYGLIEI